MAIDSGVVEILGSLHLDSELDKMAATTAVLGTGVDLLLRLRRYELYPFKMSLMCSAWNEHHGMACSEFLNAKEDELDVGFGLPLQQEARDHHLTEAQALRWLQSPSCQGMLKQVWKGSSATNLPVERKHVETKRNEKSRLCHLATAGRDQLQRHVLPKRTEAVRVLEQAERAQRRVNKMQVSALAWQRMPRDDPGQRDWQGARGESGGRPSTVWTHGNIADVHPEEQEGIAAKVGGYEVGSR